MKKVKIDRHKFYMDVYKHFDTRIGNDVMRLFDEAEILPKCQDSTFDDDHEWKYYDNNEFRKCKRCGEKMMLCRGEWILDE